MPAAGLAAILFRADDPGAREVTPVRERDFATYKPF
jgi:hypothetical protein